MNEQLTDDLRLLEAPQPWQLEWWIAVALIVLLVIALWMIRRRRAILARFRESKLILHAHEDALAALAKLSALLSEEQARPYSIESSAVIRRYLENRFQIRAPLRSTEEFLHEARHSPKLSPEFQALLGEFLKFCDLIKFARVRAYRTELENFHASAVRFVTETRVKESMEASD
ncbi:MAG: hypothetical protein JWL90_674 [Chthoniobacteraceae bacterium]|nr:hypothetical protein [Chthoniobacteraceae bacterium]